MFRNDGTFISENSGNYKRKAFYLGGQAGCGSDARTSNTKATVNLWQAVTSGSVSYDTLKNYNYLYMRVESQANKNITGRQQIRNAYLKRNAFTDNPILRIHTADDQMLTIFAILVPMQRARRRISLSGTKSCPVRQDRGRRYG